MHFWRSPLPLILLVSLLTACAAPPLLRSSSEADLHRRRAMHLRTVGGALYALFGARATAATWSGLASVSVNNDLFCEGCSDAERRKSDREYQAALGLTGIAAASIVIGSMLLGASRGELRKAQNRKPIEPE